MTTDTETTALAVQRFLCYCTELVATPLGSQGASGTHAPSLAAAVARRYKDVGSRQGADTVCAERKTPSH